MNSTDWYAISEWPFADLRAASALIKLGMKKEAKSLIDAVTDYAGLNFNYIAELYDYYNENYGGAVPMVGYGAGANILAVREWYEQFSSSLQ